MEGPVSPAPPPSDLIDPMTDDPASSQRRSLPVGPLGLLIITAIALVAAFGVAKVLLDTLSPDSSVDVQTALNGAPQPLVADASTRAEVGGPAPNARLEYLDGTEGFLNEVVGTGTPAVLNFWSSTCIPCLKEMPAFEQIHNEVGDKVAFLGVDVVDTVEAGRKMVDKTGVTYPNVRDPRSEIFGVYGGIALPRTVLIAGDGTIVDTHSGELNADELRDLLVEHGFIPA